MKQTWGESAGLLVSAAGHLIGALAVLAAFAVAVSVILGVLETLLY